MTKTFTHCGPARKLTKALIQCIIQRMLEPLYREGPRLLGQFAKGIGIVENCKQTFFTTHCSEKDFKMAHRLISSTGKVVQILKNGLFTGNFKIFAQVQPKSLEARQFTSQSSVCLSNEPKGWESRESRISEISSSSSLGSSESRSRYRDECVIKPIASCSMRITRDMRHKMFGLPTATTALIFANEKGIANVDDEYLGEILREGQILFQVSVRRAWNSETPHGSISSSQMEGPIRSYLSNVFFNLTFSPEIASNVQLSFVGSLKRSELLQYLKRFGKENHLGVLQVDDFYMALVFENDLFYIVNPGIGSSSECADSSDLLVHASLKKFHRRGCHLLVDELIGSFKLENPNNAELKYKIMAVSITII